jgi:uncharacterized protein YbaR (Trm112 family)
MIAPELLQILRCPQTLLPVRLALPEELARFSSAAGPQPPLEEGLIREDGKVLFPIRNGIPVMLMEEAIGIA